MTTSSRPSWDVWALGIAAAVGTRGDCSRRQVGAVLMASDHTIVSTGHNGSAPGEPGCLSDRACPRAWSKVLPGSSYDTGPGACIAIHAELNALLRASWVEQAEATLYVTEEPCEGCMKIIGASRVRRAVWPTSEWNRSP